MNRGPKPRPTPAPNHKRPTCPSSLCPEAKTEWRRLTNLLDRNGMIGEVDGDGLALLCETTAVWREAMLKVHESGLIVKASTGSVSSNPFWTIARQAGETMYKLQASFGMLPSERGRVKSTTVQTTKERTEPPTDVPALRIAE